MRIIFTVFICLLLGVPFVVKAEMPIVFADASSSIFRFQYKLAEQGNAEAQYKVGEMYEMGRGVPQDKAKAREWYIKASRQNHQKSSYRLLYLDIQVSGMNPERKQQVDKLRQEAGAGVADAQYFLGKMYASGVGVEKDLNQAQNWLNKAAFNGIAEAESDRIVVDDELARMQAKQAQQKAEAEAERQKKEAAEKAKKDREAQDARDKELAAKREAQRREAARQDAERQRKERESAAAERQRQEKQRAAKPAPAPAPAKEQKPDTPEVDENAVFESDPCKGKKAKFLSICK